MYTGKKVVQVARKGFEDNVGKTIEGAKNTDIAILVIGDPLVATTHHIILQEARRQGIQYQVFHSSSIFSAAIGESGLDIYKFGPTTTVPFWYSNYKPTSFVDVIEKNLKNGQHTLLLLDINQTSLEPMGLEDAASIMGASMHKGGGLSRDTRLLVMGDIGRDSQKVAYAKVEFLRAMASGFKGMVLCMIIPGKTNFAEDDELSRFSD